jgi:tetratricopeptide (TPR) repeat protein
MKSEKPGRHSRKGRGGSPRSVAGSPPAAGSNAAGKLALVLICLMAAVAAFWATTKLLGPGKPVILATNFASVHIPAGSNSAPPQPGGGETALTEMTPPPIDTNDPIQLLNRGTEYLDYGRVETAIDHYLRALAINPEDEEAHFNLGFAYVRQKNTAKAIEHYREAIRLFPDYGEAHNNLGNILVAQKKYDEAMGHYSAAIRISPDNSSALNNLGRCLGEQGRTEEALKQFLEAVRLNPNYVEAHFNLGNSYLLLGKPDEAISQFEKLLQIAPGFQPAQAALQRAKNAKAQAGRR